MMPQLGKLTIVHVTTPRTWYGGEEQARVLIEGLRDRGHRCVVFARRGGQFAERMRKAGFEVTTFLSNGRNPIGILRMRRRLTRLKPDVLHFHDPHALTAGGLAALGLAIKARVASRRVDYPLRFPGRYLRLCDRVIADSHAIAQACGASGIPRDRLRVVHEGVDPARAQSGNRKRGRQSLALDDDQLLLLTVASLKENKGHIDLLHALPAVLAKWPQLRVALAGDGPLGESLRAEARRRGLADRISFLGYRPDVPDLLHAADVFIMPSRIEGLGSSLIDAMLARVPIVTTTAGGIPELVAGEGDEPAVAFTVPPRDPTALAEAILEALDSPQKRRTLAEAAEQRASRLFTADRMVENTLRVYQELLAPG